MRLVLLACALVALASSQAPKSSPPTQDPCFRPLEEFCAWSKCVTYAEQVRSARATGHCTSTSFGRCGTLRTTYTSSGLAAETRYFDKHGTLIAVRFEPDLVITACPNWIHYG